MKNTAIALVTALLVALPFSAASAGTVKNKKKSARTAYQKAKAACKQEMPKARGQALRNCIKAKRAAS